MKLVTEIEGVVIEQYETKSEAVKDAIDFIANMKWCIDAGARNDDTLYIKYNDGTSYSFYFDEGERGTFKKSNIKSVIISHDNGWNIYGSQAIQDQIEWLNDDLSNDANMNTETKNYLNDELAILHADLTDYAKNFVDEHDANDDSYICDAISEFADSNTSIYYSDIEKFISENVDAVNDAIDELGWEGCDRSLYKAGQMAEYMQIENMVNNDITYIVQILAINQLLKCDYDLSIDQIETILNNVSCLDNDNRFSDILVEIKSVCEEVE